MPAAVIYQNIFKICFKSYFVLNFPYFDKILLKLNYKNGYMTLSIHFLYVPNQKKLNLRNRKIFQKYSSFSPFLNICLLGSLLYIVMPRVYYMQCFLSRVCFYQGFYVYGLLCLWSVISWVSYVQCLLCLWLVMSMVCFVQGLSCLLFVMSIVCYVYGLSCLVFVLSRVCYVKGLLCLGFGIQCLLCLALVMSRVSLFMVCLSRVGYGYERLSFLFI